jgi:hypothetical protein
VVSQFANDRWPFTAKLPDVCLEHLGEPSVVTGPGEHVFGEQGELFPPARVIVRYVARSDDEEVDVARGVAVAAGRRSEDRQVDGSDLPAGDLAAQAMLELGPDVREELYGGRGEVLPVERVQIGVAASPRSLTAL